MSQDNNILNADKIDQWVSDAMNGSLSLPMSINAEAAINAVFHQTKRMMWSMVDYKDLMMMYTCALKAVQTKFDILNTEFKVRHQRNPISSITTRLKRTSSITEKLVRQNRAFSIETIEENINDVAGIRVICTYIDDIYTIADSLLNQDDVQLVQKKDYIADPKPNGYRSLHLIIKVPVFFADQRKEMKVEVQIRTIAMDYWASLEHQLKYKQNIPEQDEIVERLKICADTINATDEEMLKIRRQLEEAADTPTEEQVLFERIHNLDVPIG